MYVGNSYATQFRAFSGTGKIAGISLPDFNDNHVYTKKKSSTGDSKYEKTIKEQAAEDQAVGKFQMESQGFAELMKRYVSEISPDRKGIITGGLQKVVKDKIPAIKPLDLVEILLGDGKVKYQKGSNMAEYAEFYDSNGEMVATYSNGGWTMLDTKAETARKIHMCSIYNKAWREAKVNMESVKIKNNPAINDENSNNTFDSLA